MAVHCACLLRPPGHTVKLSRLSGSELARRLNGPGLFLHTGPFLSRIRTRIPQVVEGISLLYADYPAPDHEAFADYHISLEKPAGLRAWYHPQVLFKFDGLVPFKPLPLAQALPFLEWGLNWSIASHANHFLIIHAATIEKDGLAAILPGAPGAGKSTLTAFLVNNGWRLLSDELALVSLNDGRITPLARPVSLKNESIDIIRQVIPGATISALSKDTAKGTVALLKAPSASIERVTETARPAWIIFPRFAKGAATELTPRSKASTLIELGDNAFNYSIHGEHGFELLAGIVDRCACFEFTYSELAEAQRTFAALEPEGGAAEGAMA